MRYAVRVVMRAGLLTCLKPAPAASAYCRTHGPSNSLSRRLSVLARAHASHPARRRARCRPHPRATQARGRPCALAICRVRDLPCMRRRRSLPANGRGPGPYDLLFLQRRAALAHLPLERSYTTEPDRQRGLTRRDRSSGCDNAAITFGKPAVGARAAVPAASRALKEPQLP